MPPLGTVPCEEETSFNVSRPEAQAHSQVDSREAPQQTPPAHRQRHRFRGHDAARVPSAWRRLPTALLHPIKISVLVTGSHVVLEIVSSLSLSRQAHVWRNTHVELSRRRLTCK